MKKKLKDGMKRLKEWNEKFGRCDFIWLVIVDFEGKENKRGKRRENRRREIEVFLSKFRFYLLVGWV